MAEIRRKYQYYAYTTRAWKGGQSRELWLSEGKPKAPGRLNDLRHIVYKSFDEDARSAAPNIAIMTREGILKENIDGESVLWAVDRLERAKAKKRLLFVVTDGSPMDDSTLSVNPAHFLPRHLYEVAAWLQTRPNLTAFAVGIGFDVSRYYARGATVKNLNKLGQPILKLVRETLD